MGDIVSWVLDATLRPPPPHFNSLSVPDNAHAAFNFDARSNWTTSCNIATPWRRPVDAPE